MNLSDLRSNLRRWVTRSICAGVILTGAQAMAQQDMNLGKIMPMGDSITAGDVTGGYRTRLGQALEAAGYTFQFVGSSTVNSDTGWAQWLVDTNNEHHEGHSGFTITQIPGYRDGIDNNLNSYIGPSGEDPDYILLMIGTNDIVGGYTEGASDRLNALIGHISDKTTGLRPDAHLIVASIPPIGINSGFSSTAHTDAPIYNAGVKAAVLQHQALGENVTFVDVFSYLDLTDLGADQLHPDIYGEGYTKIAQAWMDGIQSTLAIPEPTTMALLIPALAMLMRLPRKRASI